MDTALPYVSHSYKILATEDATKWNECISSELFLMMHRTFFCPLTRQELTLPPPTEDERIFLRIFETGHFLIAIKMITLGEGPLSYGEACYRRLQCRQEDIPFMNAETRQWATKLLPDIVDETYIQSSGGMLMGMHNAASTTAALPAIGFRQLKHNCRVSTLRSSDDSMTLFIGAGLTDVYRAIEENRKCLKLLGVNLSPDKSFLFKEGYGEYTSWYLDGKFVAQYGVETASLRPQGKNPADDFYSIAKTTEVSQTRLEIIPFGAELRLRVGIDNVRRLWRIMKV